MVKRLQDIFKKILESFQKKDGTGCYLDLGEIGELEEIILLMLEPQRDQRADKDSERAVWVAKDIRKEEVCRAMICTPMSRKGT